MEIRTLNYFLEAANTLSFTQAAKKCFVTQTAISLAVSKLEQELGVVLFDRSHRTVALTPAGEEFRRWAKDAYSSYNATVKRCQEIARGNVGYLHLGVNSVFDGFYMQWLLKDLNYDKIDVNVRMSAVQGLLPALSNRHIDAFLSPPWEYEKQTDLNILILESFDLVLIMDNSHPLAKYEVVPPEILHDYDALILTYQGLVNSETQFLKKLSDNNVAFKHLVQKNHIEEVLMNLPNSNRVALLPSFIIDIFGQGFTSRRIEGYTEAIPFALISLKESNNPIIATLELALRNRKERFIDQLDASAEEGLI